MNDKKMIGMGMIMLGVWVMFASIHYMIQYAFDVIAGLDSAGAHNDAAFLQFLLTAPGIVWIIIGVKLVRRNWHENHEH